jgi:hypothetical protein
MHQALYFEMHLRICMEGWHSGDERARKRDIGQPSQTKQQKTKTTCYEIRHHASGMCGV